MGCSQSIPAVVSSTPRAYGDVRDVRRTAARDSASSVTSQLAFEVSDPSTKHVFGNFVNNAKTHHRSFFGGSRESRDENGVRAFEAPPESTRDDRRQKRHSSPGTLMMTRPGRRPTRDDSSFPSPANRAGRETVSEHACFATKVPARVFDIVDTTTTDSTIKTPTTAAVAVRGKGETRAATRVNEELSSAGSDDSAGVGGGVIGGGTRLGRGSHQRVRSYDRYNDDGCSSCNEGDQCVDAIPAGNVLRKETSGRERFLAKQMANAKQVRRPPSAMIDRHQRCDGGDRTDEGGGGAATADERWATKTTMQTQPDQQSRQRLHQRSHRRKVSAAKIGAARLKIEHLSSSHGFRSSAADDGMFVSPPNMGSPTMRTEPLTLKGSQAPPVVAPLSRKMINARARLPPLRIPGKDASEVKQKPKSAAVCGNLDRPLLGGTCR